ncbi:WD repeat and HMG-box DNA binding-domain containing protein 1 [Balamuthia mandrillaris]
MEEATGQENTQVVAEGEDNVVVVSSAASHPGEQAEETASHADKDQEEEHKDEEAEEEEEEEEKEENNGEDAKEKKEQLLAELFVDDEAEESERDEEEMEMDGGGEEEDDLLSAEDYIQDRPNSSSERRHRRLKKTKTVSSIFGEEEEDAESNVDGEEDGEEEPDLTDYYYNKEGQEFNAYEETATKKKKQASATLEKKTDEQVDSSNNKKEKETGAQAEDFFSASSLRKEWAVLRSQPAFQPNSGPLTDSRRFLSWNLFGMIHSVSESTSSILEVEFSDQLSDQNLRSFRMSNLSDFSMGTMGPYGALFAAKSDATQGIPSNIYRPFNSWAAKTEWTANLPFGEEVECIAVGSKWVAVATSRQYLRLFSYAGVQTGLFVLGGPVVALAAQRDFLAVAYHASAAVAAKQNIVVQLYDIYNQRIVTEKPLPLGDKGVTLAWIGFSEEGMLCIADSNEIVSALLPSWGWQWTPILDFAEVRKQKSDRHWVIGIKQDQLIYVPVSPSIINEEASSSFGSSSVVAPCPLNRPTIRTCSLSIPLLQRDTKAGFDEERVLRNRLFSSHELFQQRYSSRSLLSDPSSGLSSFDLSAALEEFSSSTSSEENKKLVQIQAKLDSQVLEMMQNACKADRPVRALDLASQLQLKRSLNIALKLANHHHMIELAHRIELLQKSRTMKADEEQKRCSTGGVVDVMKLKQQLDLQLIEMQQEKAQMKGLQEQLVSMMEEMKQKEQLLLQVEQKQRKRVQVEEAEEEDWTESTPFDLLRPFQKKEEEEEEEDGEDELEYLSDHERKERLDKGKKTTHEEDDEEDINDKENNNQQNIDGQRKKRKLDNPFAAIGTQKGDNSTSLFSSLEKIHEKEKAEKEKKTSSSLTGSSPQKQRLQPLQAALTKKRRRMTQTPLFPTNK